MGMLVHLMAGPLNGWRTQVDGNPSRPPSTITVDGQRYVYGVNRDQPSGLLPLFYWHESVGNHRP